LNNRLSRSEEGKRQLQIAVEGLERRNTDLQKSLTEMELTTALKGKDDHIAKLLK